MSSTYFNRFSLLALVIAIIAALLNRYGVTPQLLGEYLNSFNLLVATVAGFLVNQPSTQSQLSKPGRPPITK